MQQAEWQAVVFAGLLLVTIGATTVAAIWRYGVDGALKIIATTTGITGVLTGIGATYFFTREPLEAARREATAYKVALEQTQSTLEAARVQVAEYKTAAANASDPAVQAQVETAFSEWEAKHRADKLHTRPTHQATAGPRPKPH